MALLQWVEANVARVAELICVNRGSMAVGGQIGQSVPDGNRYGRLGLTVQEAFEITYLRGYLEALSIGVPEATVKQVMLRIQQEMSGNRIMIPTAEEKSFLLSPASVKAIKIA